MSIPTYIYKIVPSSTPPPTPLPDKLPVSELDKASGFLHLSTAVQIPGTLKYFFDDIDIVYILRIEYKSVEKDTKWQNEAGALGGVGEEKHFPHVYNDLRLGKAEIESVAEWKRDSKGWDSAIEKARSESWLIY